MKKTLILVLTCVLVACGGGSSSTPTLTTPTAVTAPVAINTSAVLKNIASSAGSSWTSATDTSGTRASVYANTYSADSIFNVPDGTKINNVKVLELKIQDMTSGTLTDRKLYNLIFDKDATKLVGVFWNRDNSLNRCMYNPNIIIPASVAIGTSGVWVNGPAYSGDLSCPGGQVQLPNARLLWSVEDIASTHNFCLALEDGFKFSDFKLCFPVSVDGAIDWRALTLSWNNVTHKS